MVCCFNRAQKSSTILPCWWILPSKEIGKPITISEICSALAMARIAWLLAIGEELVMDCFGNAIPKMESAMAMPILRSP